MPSGQRHVRFDPEHTRIYRRRLAGEREDRAMSKTVNQKAWLFVLPVVALVAFNAIIPLMTVVNYSVQSPSARTMFFWAGVQWFEQVLTLEPLPRRAAAPDPVHRPSCSSIEVPLGLDHRAVDAAQGPVGLGLPRTDGAAAADSLERGRRHVEHPGAARTSACSAAGSTRSASPTTIPRQPLARLVHHRPRWMSGTGRRWSCFCAMPAWSRSPTPITRPPRSTARSAWAVFRYIQLPKLRIRADHRHPAALHGFVHDLHRGGGADRRRPGQLDHLPRRSTCVKTALGQFDLGPAAAMSLIYFLIILLLSWLFYTLMTRNEASDGHLVSMPCEPPSRARVRLRAARLITTIYILFLLLPIYWLAQHVVQDDQRDPRRLHAVAAQTSRSTTTGSSSPTRPGTTATSPRSNMSSSTRSCRWRWRCRRPTPSRATASSATSTCSSGC